MKPTSRRGSLTRTALLVAVLLLATAAGCGFSPSARQSALSGTSAEASTSAAGTPVPAKALAATQTGNADEAKTWYVSPDGNDSWGGLLADPNTGKTDGPFRTFARACGALEAGDTLLIRGGSYAEALVPFYTGTAEKPIIIKNYEQEKVVITKGSPVMGITDPEKEQLEKDDYAFYIFGKSYITIEGISIDFTEMGDKYMSRWGRIVDSDHITLKNDTFKHAMIEGTSGGVLLMNSHCNTITGNSFDEGNDNLTMVQSDYNLIDGNTFTSGRHTLWNIRAGSYNVLRNNYFHNALQKIGEIYDNGSWSASKYGTVEENAARHNVVESNTFAYTPPEYGLGGSPYNGIQFAGQECIIRNNVFYDVTGGGLGLTLYEDEAYFNHSNRIYNNTFVNNQYGGIFVPRVSSDAPNYIFYNNIVKNNILYNNIYNELGERHNYDDWVLLRGKPVQIWGVRTNGLMVFNNDFFGLSGDRSYEVSFGDYTEHHSVAGMESNFPHSYGGNLGVDPLFVKLDSGYDPAIPHAAKHDLHLQDSSPLIDAGTFLTTVIPPMVKGEDGDEEGKGNEIVVNDSLYFSDGFGLIKGDHIKLQNGENAFIVKIAYGIRHNVITLDKEVNWKAGDGVALYYTGKAPDMGAFENAGAPAQQ